MNETMIFNLSELLLVTGGLTLVVNVVTEVIKKTFPMKTAAIKLTALLVSLVITNLTFFSYCSAESITLRWYCYPGGTVLGFFVAYAAMFGFDTLKDLVNAYSKGAEG